MTLFNYYIMVDWSASSKKSSKNESSNAIWIAHGSIDESPQKPIYCRTRCDAFEKIKEIIKNTSNSTILVGFDFAFGYPRDFSIALTKIMSRNEKKSSYWKECWSIIQDYIRDNENNENNRFEAANMINLVLYSKNKGPFWGCPHGKEKEYQFLSEKKSPSFPFVTKNGFEIKEFRLTEEESSKEKSSKRPQSPFKIFLPGSVGGQTLLGIPYLYMLRFNEFLDSSKVWPFETKESDFEKTLQTKILFVEIFPSLIEKLTNKSTSGKKEREIKDREQVLDVWHWVEELDKKSELGGWLKAPYSHPEQEIITQQEGWILGVRPNS